MWLPEYRHEHWTETGYCILGSALVMQIFVSVTSFPYNIDVLNGNLLCNAVHYFASIAKSHDHCREHRLDVACLNCLYLDISSRP
jgi:hypothetical protein